MFTKAQQAAIFALLAGLGAVGPARAAQRGCASVTIETDGDVLTRWPDLAARIRAAIDGRDDADRCARVALRLEQATIVVTVVLPDGRAASRSVSRGEDIVPTLEALLLLPRPDARAPDAAPAGAAAPVRAPARADAAPKTAATDPGAIVAARPDATATPAGPDADDRLRLELSLATSARVGDGQTGFRAGALGFLELSGWLIGFAGAVDRYQGSASGPPAPALELAALAGRRVRFEATTLDFVAGPALAMRGINSTRSVMAGSTGGAPPPETSDGPWTRLLAGVRLTFRARALLRPFVGLDGELALERSAADVPAGEPRLPTWTAGLVLGLTAGTP